MRIVDGRLVQDDGSPYPSDLMFRTITDPVPWADLSGIPASFSPDAHAASHAAGAADQLSLADLYGNLPWSRIIGAPAAFTPSAHAASHHSGGTDPLALDSIAGALSATKISGTFAKAQQHAQTAYKDVDNSFTQRQTFNRPTGIIAQFNASGSSDARVEFQHNGVGMASFNMNVGVCNIAPQGTNALNVNATTIKIGGTDVIDASRVVMASRLGIGTAGAPAAASALDVSSTTGGLLPPRMTTAQRDAISIAPPAGLTVFNTDVGKQQTYDGSAWQNHW